MCNIFLYDTIQKEMNPTTCVAILQKTDVVKNNSRGQAQAKKTVYQK